MTLNGWRRLWIVWAVVAVPAALIIATAIGLPSSSESIRRERSLLEEAAIGRAMDRATAQMERELGPTSDAQEIARRAAIVIGRVTREDKVALDERAAIEAQYAPRIEAAERENSRLHMMLAGVLWLLLAGGVYFLGSVTAWVRRGFSRTA